jgi:hypothetical protein
VIPVVVVGVQERTRRRTARGGDEVVEPAELLERLVDEPDDIVFDGQVALDGVNAGVARGLIAEFFGRGREPVLVAAVDDYVDALADERGRGRLSEAVAGRRRQRDVAVDG